MKTLKPLLPLAVGADLAGLAGLVVVSELDVLAVDDRLLLAGLTAGARLHRGLGGRGQGGDQGDPGREVITAGEGEGPGGSEPGWLGREGRGARAGGVGAVLALSVAAARAEQLAELGSLRLGVRLRGAPHVDSGQQVVLTESQDIK